MFRCRYCYCKMCDVIKTVNTVVKFSGVERIIVKRTRRCRHCGLPFTTIETYESEDKTNTPETGPVEAEQPTTAKKNPYI